MKYTTLEKVLAKEKPDEIIHLAAQAGVRYSLTNPWSYIESNELGTLNVFEAARHLKLARVAYVSSSSVYGANTKSPLSENDRTDRQLAVYGVAAGAGSTDSIGSARGARNDYDRVFVHMNEECALLGGLFWRMMGKKIVLWRNHKMGSWGTRIGVALADTVCYTSPEAFVVRYKNAVVMPVGIDTHCFVPPASPAPDGSILFLGRLDPVKKVEMFVEALTGISAPFHADLYGSPTRADSPYAKKIVAQAQPLVKRGVLTLHSGVPHDQRRELYRSHALYVNLTPSGSFDKTIGEAMASGCIIVSSNSALRDIIHPALMVRDSDAVDVARGMNAALSLSVPEHSAEAQKLRTHIEKNHSLERLMINLRK